MEAKARGRVQRENSILWSKRILGHPFLRKTGFRCIYTIMKYFFFLQYRQAVFKRRAVAQVDHPLDEKIPFTPAKVNIYLDFIAYWIRTVGFMVRYFGRQGLEDAVKIINSIAHLYKWAAKVYSVKFSTTRRPLYLKRLRFLTIHAFDPHLMCIPSLHVMVVIRTYTLFRKLLRRMGKEEECASQIEEVFRDGIAVTEAVLYIKQHSVNCISAAMYAMTRLDPSLFPPEEAEFFVSKILRDSPSISGADQELIREHIQNLYLRFMAEGKDARRWNEPLVNFMAGLPVSK